MILSILTGGIDLPKVSNEVASLRLASEDTNAALADHIVKANARMTTIEGVVSNNTAECQIRMNGLQDLIASRALAEDVETLRLKLNRLDGAPNRKAERAIAQCVELTVEVEDVRATVASLTKQVEALTAAKLSEVKARKAPAKK